MGQAGYDEYLLQAIIDINSANSVNSAHRPNKPLNRLILELGTLPVFHGRTTRFLFQMGFRAVRSRIFSGTHWRQDL